MLEAGHRRAVQKSGSIKGWKENTDSSSFRQGRLSGKEAREAVGVPWRDMGVADTTIARKDF